MPDERSPHDSDKPRSAHDDFAEQVMARAARQLDQDRKAAAKRPLTALREMDVRWLLACGVVLILAVLGAGRMAYRWITGSDAYYTVRYSTGFRGGRSAIVTVYNTNVGVHSINLEDVAGHGYAEGKVTGGSGQATFYVSWRDGAVRTVEWNGSSVPTGSRRPRKPDSDNTAGGPPPAPAPSPPPPPTSASLPPPPKEPVAMLPGDLASKKLPPHLQELLARKMAEQAQKSGKGDAPKLVPGGHETPMAGEAQKPAVSDRPPPLPPLTPAQLAAESMLPALKDLRARLESRPKTPQELVQLAAWCREKQLDLEAEECLRAALLVAPDMKEARERYEKTKPNEEPLPRTVTTPMPCATRVDKLMDGQHPLQPASGQVLVSLPLEFHPAKDILRMETRNWTCKAQGGAASFRGIHRAPSQGSKTQQPAKGAPRPSGMAELWEVVLARADGDGILVRLQNRVRTTAKRTPSRSGEKQTFSLDRDASSFDERYRGPYQAIFSIPEGESLTRIQFDDEPSIRLLSKKFTSLDAFLLDPATTPSECLTALDLATADPSRSTLPALEAAMARKEGEVFRAAREAMRRVRRQLNLVDGVYLPTSPGAQECLVSLKTSQTGGGGTKSIRHPRGSRVSETLFVLPSASYSTQFEASWRLREPGRYFSRVLTFDDAPPYAPKGGCQVSFAVPRPGVYAWKTATAGRMDGPVKLAELWKDGRLLERKLVGGGDGAASTVLYGAAVASPPPAAATVPLPADQQPTAGQAAPTAMPSMLPSLAGSLPSPAGRKGLIDPASVRGVEAVFIQELTGHID